MVTRIVSNSGKRNRKPFRINAGVDKFYGILHRASAGNLCRISELVTFVSEYVTQNVRINDIRATRHCLHKSHNFRLSVLVAVPF